jgi:hypothetical protein
MMNISQHTPDISYTAFQYYPFNSVVGFIGSEDPAEAAVLALCTAGFTGETVGILHGEHGIRASDRRVKGHGIVGRAARALQNLSDQETALLQRSETEMQKGSFLFRVRTNGNREVMQQVRAILKDSGGYFITFYHAVGTEIVDN